MKKSARCLCLIAAMAAAWMGSAAAAEQPVFTADLPFDAAQPLPSWMHGPPVSAPGGGARVAFRLSPPPGRDLLLHLVFDETAGAGLRVEWQRDGQGVSEAVAENLGEGLGVPNQRALLVSASRLGGNGTLLLQGGGSMNVNRVKFEWVAERTTLAASTKYVPVVVTASRLALAEADVDGGPRPELQDEWRDRVVRASLTQKPEVLTPSLEFQAVLEEAPKLARLEVSVAGVFLDQEVWVIVNNHEVGPLAIEVPTLEDPGHLGRPGRAVEFAGWRGASSHLPADLLLPGENSVVLELRSPANSGYRNRTLIREAVLELAYSPRPVEPNLSLPVSDLPEAPSDDVEVEEEPPLPPVEPPPSAGPAGALTEFWGSGAGSL